MVANCSDIEGFIDKLNFVVRVLNELADQEGLNRGEYERLVEELVVKLVNMKFGEVKAVKDEWLGLNLYLECIKDGGEAQAEVNLSHDELWELVLATRCKSRE